MLTSGHRSQRAVLWLLLIRLCNLLPFLYLYIFQHVFTFLTRQKNRPSVSHHSYRQHLNAKRQGNIDLTEQDYLNIPDYIDGYDDILAVNTFKQGDREVVLGKKINGYSVIMALISNKRKSLHFKNMWGLDTPTYEKRYEKGRGSAASHPGRSSVSANDPTEMIHGASSGLSISQPIQVVNPRLALPGDIPADIPPGLRKLYLLAQEMSASPPPREIPQRPVQQSPQEILSQLAWEMARDSLQGGALDSLSNEDIRAMLEEIAAGNEGLQSDTGDGILTSGAISGALNPEGKRARKHAVTYYGLVRKMTTDVARIAKNTGYSKEQIQRIKNFLFVDEHDLGGGKVARFDPSYEIAQSWQRLLDGKEIQPHDLTLLMHEILESELMGKGHTQDEAHRIASKKYDYRREAEEYYGQAEEYS